MNLNYETFFAYVRNAPFGGRLTISQVQGLEAVLRAFKDGGHKDPRFLAYIMATAYHETGGKIQAVREGFAKTDAAARKIVSKYKYGKPDEITGHVYYGRGLVQLTWKENYATARELTGFDLVNNPDKALDLQISAYILVEGMVQGLFTGKALKDYFKEGYENPEGARKIVNGTDKDELIAGYYFNFIGAIEKATQAEKPKDVTKEKAQPDKPNLATDQTLLGGISAVAGSGALGVFSSIDSPWALAAFAIVCVGAWAFLTGRLKIIREAGA
jgi:hypothetical protein